MKAKLFVVFSLLALASLLVGAVSAQGGEPITLNLNLGVDPLTLDPALATDTDSVTVIEQLFIGLVDLDDDTAEVRPELATSWEVSPDSTVYTFTLRSDVYWTDGHQVTAQDVRYGILRTLNPTTSGYAYPLFVIKNAQGYNEGTITDPNQVGVAALDDTHLRVTLEYPTSYALSILSMWVARPMPQWAIETWGDAWTDPARIVTNGPYRLSEWVHGDHILLDKNPTYYDAANVQIERVKMWMVGANMGWTMYLNGQLDTAAIPGPGHAGEVFPEEIHIQPIPCTYYYGFSTSQPPFNNPLVRKAFAAATDREGLIRNIFGGLQQPALTFTPPGVFGHVDGYAEGVGIPYDPAQARQWLADAGYPNGQGLPPITLWFNTGPGHQAIAEYLRDKWHATLGGSVTLQSLEWGEYSRQLNNGQFQIWRQGWCMDYPDANNFLRDAIEPHRGAYGGWYNATYEGLLDQAARTPDPAARKALYKQAEEILVETDAVMIPLYYYASAMATKPYLERTYGVGGSLDIATWRITRVSGAVGPGGGSLTSYHGDTVIKIPAGAITDTVVITHAPAYGISPGGNLTGIGHVFDVTAVYSSTGQPAQLGLGQTYTITVQYTEAEKGPTIESTLALYYWDGSQWVREPSSVVDTAANTVTAHPDHFSLWAVLGETRRLYLPLVLRH